MCTRGRRGARTFLVKVPAAASISSTSRSVNNPVFHPSQAVAHSSETVQIYKPSPHSERVKRENIIHRTTGNENRVTREDIVDRTPGGHDVMKIECQMVMT